ncbi:MAG: zinc-binding dehydrogenase [Anaerolineales bacterium]
MLKKENCPSRKRRGAHKRHLATSACFTDTMIRKGIYYGVKQKPPFAPGYDVVGVIDELGEGVTHLKVGQRVADLTVTGAYAEYMCIPAAHCVSVPESVDASEAVSLVLTYITAYQMLHRIAKVKRSDRILVHGASGAVGTALIQLGILHGLEIYGTASKASREPVSTLGATPIDYQDENFVHYINELTPKGVDAVFDAIGGANFARSFQCLRKGGVLVAYGSYGCNPDIVRSTVMMTRKRRHVSCSLMFPCADRGKIRVDL